MRQLLAVSLLALLLPFAAYRQKPDDFSFSISLTRGERSRDSHSQTTTITLKGRELIYEKSYRGYRGGSRRAPVKKVFSIRNEDLEHLKKVVRDKNLLASDMLSVADEGGGVRRYFEMALNVSLDGKTSSIEISGPVTAVEIKEKSPYQKALSLLDIVYKILAEQDKEIGYEHKDLIEEGLD